MPPNHPEFEQHIASGTLVRYNDSHFMVTAAHVFDAFDHKSVSYIAGNDAHTFGGEIVLTKPLLSKRNERIDTAVIKVDNSTVNRLRDAGHEFYNLGAQNPNLTLDGNSTLLLFGFPITKSKLNKYTRRGTFKPFEFITKVSNNHLKEYDDQIQIQLSFVKNKVKRLSDQTVINAPKQTGMSGSGIWVVTKSNESRSAHCNYAFAGIYTEYRSADAVIVGTQVNIIAKIIRTNF